jgi:hypothetical protein
MASKFSILKALWSFYRFVDPNTGIPLGAVTGWRGLTWHLPTLCLLLARKLTPLSFTATNWSLQHVWQRLLG